MSVIILMRVHILELLFSIILLGCLNIYELFYWHLLNSFFYFFMPLSNFYLSYFISPSWAGFDIIPRRVANRIEYSRQKVKE